MKQTLKSCLSCIALAILSASAIAAEQPDWEQQIVAEALDTLNCEVSFISHIVERDIPAGSLVMAKIHCVDKRSFDALRENNAAPFTFKECTPREQKSC
jgi:hypothetical protein